MSVNNSVRNKVLVGKTLSNIHILISPCNLSLAQSKMNATYILVRGPERLLTNAEDQYKPTSKHPILRDADSRQLLCLSCLFATSVSSLGRTDKPCIILVVTTLAPYCRDCDAALGHGSDPRFPICETVLLRAHRKHIMNWLLCEYKVQTSPSAAADPFLLGRASSRITGSAGTAGATAALFDASSPLRIHL